MKELKNGLFVKQAVPHNDSLATHMPIIALSGSSHLEMIQEPQKIKYIQKKQNAAVHDQSASFRNLIGASLNLRFDE